jgi:hypothetical protein
MSNKKQGSMSNLPEGWTEGEINKSADEAFEKGELKIVDILGNEEPFTKEQDIMHEMITGDEKPLSVQRVLGVVKHLQGKVLTVIDATFTDQSRLKYVKDIVKDQFSQSSSWIYEMSIREFEEDTK